MDNDKIAETRIIVDPEARRKMDFHTPATADKFWKDAIK